MRLILEVLRVGHIELMQVMIEASFCKYLVNSGNHILHEANYPVTPWSQIDALWGHQLRSIVFQITGGRDKSAIILQTFSNVFSGMRIYEFHIRFKWNLVRINNIPAFLNFVHIVVYFRNVMHALMYLLMGTFPGELLVNCGVTFSMRIITLWHRGHKLVNNAFRWVSARKT